LTAKACNTSPTTPLAARGALGLKLTEKGIKIEV